MPTALPPTIHVARRLPSAADAATYPLADPRDAIAAPPVPEPVYACSDTVAAYVDALQARSGAA